MYSNARIHKTEKIERSNVRKFNSKCQGHKLRILLKGYKMNISDMNFSIDEEFPTILVLS